MVDPSGGGVHIYIYMYIYYVLYIYIFRHTRIGEHQHHLEGVLILERSLVSGCFLSSEFDLFLRDFCETRSQFRQDMERHLSRWLAGIMAEDQPPDQTVFLGGRLTNEMVPFFPFV